jgi:hypothetical protein
VPNNIINGSQLGVLLTENCYQQWFYQIPKFPILECEPLSTINLNFQKNFISFKLK